MSRKLFYWVVREEFGNNPYYKMPQSLIGLKLFTSIRIAWLTCNPLRESDNVPAFLVFVYFVGGAEMRGPSTVEEWKSAIRVLEWLFGL